MTEGINTALLPTGKERTGSKGIDNPFPCEGKDMGGYRARPVDAYSFQTSPQKEGLVTGWSKGIHERKEEA